MTKPIEVRDGARPPREESATLSRETLVGVRAREPRALAGFFEFSFDRVYSLAARLLGDRTAAEDVTQEVFLKVQRKADRIDPDRDPMAWLAVITYNACRDYWRSRKRQPLGRAASLDGEVVGEDRLVGMEPDPETRALNRERDRAVQAAISRLPQEMRTVVLLHDYQDLNHDEIGRVIGASHAAVRKRYSRALARLAEELKDWWEHGPGRT
jgi:RNA polymerase sigma-70 factor (ECF subfamily)